MTQRGEPESGRCTAEEVAALRRENELLASQVKRLVKAESHLYLYQEQLDAQLREYRQLYELGRRLNAVFDLRGIFAAATTYVVNDLGYERVLFLQRAEEGGDYVVTAMEGYYAPAEREEVTALVVSRQDPLLALLPKGEEHLLCRQGNGEGVLASNRGRFRMDEYLLYRLGSGIQPVALLAVGNTATKAEFSRRVSDSEGALFGIGNLAGLLSSLIERTLDEEEIRRLNAELEQKIVQLEQAQEELVRKEKLSILGQLSGSVGHELRNPLGIMGNAVYFLKMVLSEADESVKEYLGIIENEVANSERIITDLLDFARTKPPQRQRITPAELVRQGLTRCAIPENVTLTVEVPLDLPLLHVDPLQMGQVLMNLITNAVQAMPEGGPLRVGAQRVRSEESGERGTTEITSPLTLHPSHDVIAIFVKDTGTGISAEHRKKLFQPLFTTKPRGIGLGLVVCKNLVTANGGTIEVASEVGKGTTFTVTLPVAEAVDERQGEEAVNPDK